MNQPNRLIIILSFLVAVLFVTVLYLLYIINIPKLFPPVYKKVLGIQINTCCSCPTPISSSQVDTDGWVLYEKGKNYSEFLPEECDRVDCLPCPPLEDETFKCVEKNSLDCTNEPELSFECSDGYQNWAGQNCPGWSEKTYCQDPRPEMCTLECIQNPPYICGSNDKSFCSVCQACSDKNIDWYETKATPCGE